MGVGCKEECVGEEEKEVWQCGSGAGGGEGRRALACRAGRGGESQGGAMNGDGKGSGRREPGRGVADEGSQTPNPSLTRVNEKFGSRIPSEQRTL